MQVGVVFSQADSGTDAGVPHAKHLENIIEAKAEVDCIVG
jgi:hypothetical protein